jgi:uncharacterized membrane protein
MSTITPSKNPSTASPGSKSVAREQPQVYDKSEPGRGYIVVIYGLYIGSIIALVTAPLGVLIAHWRLGRGAPWLDTHLRFQIRTFWLGILAAALALLLWRVLGMAQMEAVYAWSFGYLFFTLGIIWMMARCAVGIHRLTSNRAIDAPKSWLFGLGKWL